MARLSGRPLLDTAADAALFVDRDVELDRLGRAVAEGLNVLTSGPRGAGKTSLLRRAVYLGRTAGEAPGPLGSVDASAVGSADELLHRVADVLGAPSAGLPAGADGLTRLAGLDAAARRAVAVDGLSPDVAHVAFGQLRDELWSVPVTWVVSCSDRQELDFLRPPADAFFDARVRLAPFADGDLRELLRRRATPDELDDAALDVVVSLAQGNPRRALDLARHLLLAPGSGPELRAALVRRDEALDRLGAPARMLLDELDASGAASASDDALLARLGWTRPRAAQVFGQLEAEGLVRAADERNGPGRPRRIYRSADLTGVAAS
jgi:hypothetical protein